MFNVDRFSDSESYGSTYRQIGGTKLADSEVHWIISRLFEKMLADSRDPASYDRFPTVLTCLKRMPACIELPESEIRLLEQVFALHEVSTIPHTHTEALRRLHETHRLGLVSNIWSKSDLYLQEFTRAGIRDLFDVIVFSSAHGHLKPSAYLFARAIEAFNVDPSKIVFVGDSLKRDIAGAKSAGLSAVWISTDADQASDGDPHPDLIIKDLRDLLESPQRACGR